MATRVQPHWSGDPGSNEELNEQEAWDLLDRRARFYLNMSADEFMHAWDAGEFNEDADRPEVMRVAMLLPFAR
jgi:hypothetical protein